MGKQNKTAISPTREENYPEWYQQVVKAADLAEVSPVRGVDLGDGDVLLVPHLEYELRRELDRRQPDLQRECLVPQRVARAARRGAVCRLCTIGSR